MTACVVEELNAHLMHMHVNKGLCSCQMETSDAVLKKIVYQFIIYLETDLSVTCGHDADGRGILE